MGTLKNTINAFTKEEKQYFNNISEEVKIYDKREPELSAESKNKVEAVKTQIASLSDQTLSVLSSSLSTKNKLSKRPC